MKKVFFFLLLFYHFNSNSQPVDGDIVTLIISPVDASTINVYTNIYFLYVTNYVDHEIEIESNTIDLNLCYSISPFPLEGGVTHNNLIDVTSLTGEYTFNINIYEDSEGCYINVLNTGELSLILPLEEEVVLSNPTFNLKNKIDVYPNPTGSYLNILHHNDITITSIQLFDIQGKLVLEENRTSNRLNVSNLKEGLFFIKIMTDKGMLVKKIIKTN